MWETHISSSSSYQREAQNSHHFPLKSPVKLSGQLFSLPMAVKHLENTETEWLLESCSDFS